MLKTKFYALASVTTLAGLVIAATASGCGNENTDAGSSAATGGSDGGSKGGGGDKSGKPDPASQCPTEDPIDQTKLPWKPPNVTPGACTNTDLANLVKYVDSNAKATFTDWKESVMSPTCRDCIFAKGGDKWAPLVENASGELDVLNVGGCIAIASGKEECGKAYQNWVDCRLLACSTCPGSDVSGVQKCLSAANTGACADAYSEVSSTCGDKGIADAEKACEGSKFIFEGPIRAQCIGAGIGGIDAGVP